MSTSFQIGYFYLVTDAAAPILKKLFDDGLGLGAVVLIPAEDFEILRDGVLVYPIHVVGKPQTLVAVPGGRVPRAS